MVFIYILNAIAAFFLVFHALGWIASLMIWRKRSPYDRKKRKYASIITAYKNVEIAAPLIESLLKQNYTNQEIYLVADRCDKNASERLANLYQIHLILPEIPFNSKVKSIQSVVEKLDDSFDAIVIFDPDNLAHPNFLKAINKMMSSGYQAVQGQRTAKNLDTPIACLDALGEFYYNVNTRLIPFAIGSSATIAGSGMAVELNLYKSYLKLESMVEKEGKVVISEDKILQSYIVSLGETIAYAPTAIVYDEKIGTADQLQRQRTRWINTWFKHIGEGFGLLGKFSWNAAWFAILTFYPPMFLQWMFAIILIAVDLLIAPSLALLIISALMVYTIYFIHSLKLGNAPSQVISSLTTLPLFVSKQIMSLVQMKKSNKDFMVTEHTQNIRIEDLLIAKS